MASRRGADGGYWLARPADQITVADVMIALEGSLIDVRAVPLDADDTHEIHLVTNRVWTTAEADLDRILGAITLADLADQAASTVGIDDAVAG